MPFTQGNTLWKSRNRAGRQGRFATAEQLLSAAEAYFAWCDGNPWYKHEQAKRPTAEHLVIQLPTARPYTLSGLCSFWKVHRGYWRQFRASKQDDPTFVEVIERIESIIYIQKFEGAAVGVFNANIIARELGLVDRLQNRPAVSVLVRREEVGGDILIETLPAGAGGRQLAAA